MTRHKTQPVSRIDESRVDEPGTLMNSPTSQPHDPAPAGSGPEGELHAQAVAWGVPGREILHGVDVTARAGLVTGLIGPNGSGKTSLLHVMAGLRHPSAGRVLLAGRDLRQMPAKRRARAIALLEQRTDTTLRLTVEGVVELGRTPHLRRWQPRLADRDRDIVRDAMAIAEVDHLAERDWATLSGGEQQRVHLARALAQQPTVLLLDEPTNHLDIGHQLHFFETIRALHTTVLAALHDLQIAAAYCDRIAVLHDGAVVAYGTPDQVLTPDLLDEVYGIDVTVQPHPVHGHPVVRWNRPGAINGPDSRSSPRSHAQAERPPGVRATG